MNEQVLLERYAAKAAEFHLDTFPPLVGDTFVHRDAAGNRYELTLAEVDRDQRNQGTFDSFTLRFTSPRDIYFPQGHFLLEHEALGEFPLFLVPTISHDTEHNSYCVYFSLPKAP